MEEVKHDGVKRRLIEHILITVALKCALKFTLKEKHFNMKSFSYALHHQNLLCSLMNGAYCEGRKAYHLKCSLFFFYCD